MDMNKIMAGLEAILFAMGDSVEISVLAEALGVSEEDVIEAAGRLQKRYEEQESGLCLQRFEESYQLSSSPDLYPYIVRAVGRPKKLSLSQAVLETLSIIAYRQPVSRVEIEAIRGVNSDYAVNRLLSYDLICEVGRKEAPGRPLLFGTTEQFLRMFGLSSLDELPVLDAETEEEFQKESEEEVDARLGSLQGTD